jgi:flagellar hook-associated protein 2
MVSLSVDGLVSGLDTTSLIDSLVKAEGAQQARLQTRLTATTNAANAYRSVNSKLDALRTAAEAMTKAATWGAAAVSATPGTAATVTGTPLPGSVSFTVDSLAAAHVVVSTGRWNAASDPAGFSDLTFTAADGVTTTTIAVGGSGTLADAVRAINGSNLGLSATTIDTNGDAAGGLALQVTARKSGAAGRFTLDGFTQLRQGTDAQLTLGDGGTPLTVTSTSNTFSGLVPGVTLSVGAKGPVTIDVTADPKAVAASAKALVDAANAALAEAKKHSSTSTGSTAVLKGDSALRRVTGDVLAAVSALVGSDASPGSVGVELTREGTVRFDETTFLAALADDPDRTRRVLGGADAGAGADGTTGTVDDVAAVPGVVQRLLSVVEAATDASTGTLTTLAQGRDSLVADLRERIDDWDDRLALRRATLVRQFTAMETALSSLKQQSSWLAGQLASLPTSS